MKTKLMFLALFALTLNAFGNEPVPNLIFSPDARYDIGQPTRDRPGNVWAATSFRATGFNYNTTTINAVSTTTTLGSAVGAATAVYSNGLIEGVIVVANAGTLTVQMAQNVAHADTTSVFANSSFLVSRSN